MATTIPRDEIDVVIIHTMSGTAGNAIEFNFPKEALLMRFYSRGGELYIANSGTDGNPVVTDYGTYAADTWYTIPLPGTGGGRRFNSNDDTQLFLAAETSSQEVEIQLLR